MKLIWLDDFLALVKYGSFSKAAEARHVTQPAFSRRIRSLEHWLGVNLVDRYQYPTQLTATGVAFIEKAKALRTQIHSSREQLRAMASEQGALLVLAQHSLAVSFLPTWLQALQGVLNEGLIKVNAGNLHDSLEAFLSGSGDFLMSFYAPTVYQELSRTEIETLAVGTSRFLPVSAADAQGQPLFSLEAERLRLLAYPIDSFFGQLFNRECLPNLPQQVTIQRVCENALAEGLKALALKGYGVAWLPECLIEDELKQGRLRMLQHPQLTIDLPVKLYRFKGADNRLALALWEALKAHGATVVSD